MPSWLTLIGPVAVPAFVVAVSFGILAQEAGMGVAGAGAMSFFSFAGSAQLAAASLLASDAGTTTAVLAAVILNARYAAMGAAAAPTFVGSPSRRIVEAQLMVDESWAISQRPDGTFDHRALTSTGLALLALWTAGTLLGALAGNRLGDPTKLGLDVVVPIVFLALLAPRLRTPRATRIALTAAVITLATTPFLPPGGPALVALAAVTTGRRR